MTTDTVSQDKKLLKPPLKCPKCHYGGRYIVPHEDGWQCWNCMKIIYRDAPIIDLDISES
ncbi:MAG: hypothetical protein JW790_05275 [Dehalococcoidales bacterium]|nr:hypothetical protein [Dehalococcoidales bacterium]